MKISNPFRPKTAFESCLSVEGNKKQLSALYKILMKTRYIPEKVKFQWEKELGVEWSENEWTHLKSNIFLFKKCECARKSFQDEL